MALFKTWIAHIATDPSLVTHAMEEKGDYMLLSVTTGFGKSLVYQLLPFCSDSLLCSCTSSQISDSAMVVVVAPLILLMHDQVSKLVAKGVKVMCASGENSSDTLADIIAGQATHVFGSKEVFVGNKRWRSLFTIDRFSRRVVALAVDEALCIVKW